MKDFLTTGSQPLNAEHCLTRAVLLSEMEGDFSTVESARLFSGYFDSAKYLPDTDIC